ncbi:MAG: heparinase II/III family protein, partial [Lentisphaerae bacterium]|nr:heparinase II/III family protein [Lentisphaerota bacterium]
HARKLMGVKPESLIGRFACQALHYTRPLERDSLVGIGGYPSPWDPFSYLALAGLLDGDAKLLRHAARWMLSVASCEYWSNDFAGELAGTRFHHAAFTEAHVTEWMALALDWAGSALTEEGQAVVRDAISRRGLPHVQHVFAESEYIRSMNQGIAFNTGRILGLLALRHAWPRVEVRLREARDDAWEMFDKTFTRDGGSVEGPAYWLYTLQVGLLGILALARHDGRRPADLVPRKMRRAPSSPFAFASTANPGMSLPIADNHGGAICSGGLAAMFTRVFPGKASNRLAAWALRQPALYGGVAQAIIFGPTRVQKITSLVPEFLVQKKTGHLVVCRNLPGVGRVRLQLYGAPGGSGSHSHDDRGNILLEAGGEGVLVDRGIGNYNNPRMLVKRPEAHNVCVPAMPDGSVPRQSLDHPNDIVPRAAYRRGVLRAVIETTAAWPRHVKACRRRVFSPSPGVFEIADELELTRSLPATFHLHTPFAMQREGKTFVLKGKRVRVLVQPEWRPAKVIWGEEDMGIGVQGRSYGHLQLLAAPARKHRLITRITVMGR